MKSPVPADSERVSQHPTKSIVGIVGKCWGLAVRTQGAMKYITAFFVRFCWLKPRIHARPQKYFNATCHKHKIQSSSNIFLLYTPIYLWKCGAVIPYLLRCTMQLPGYPPLTMPASVPAARWRLCRSSKGRALLHGLPLQGSATQCSEPMAWMLRRPWSPAALSKCQYLTSSDHSDAASEQQCDVGTPLRLGAGRFEGAILNSITHLCQYLMVRTAFPPREISSKPIPWLIGSKIV